MATALTLSLRRGLDIGLVKPAYFIATKLDAFAERGKGDYLESHDLEDVLSVVDGRPEIVDDIAQAEPELRRYVGKIFADLVADEGFLNALPGLIVEGSPAVRAPVVLERLRTIAAMGQAR